MDAFACLANRNSSKKNKGEGRFCMHIALQSTLFSTPSPIHQTKTKGMGAFASHANRNSSKNNQGDGRFCMMLCKALFFHAKPNSSNKNEGNGRFCVPRESQFIKEKPRRWTFLHAHRSATHALFHANLRAKNARR